MFLMRMKRARIVLALVVLTLERKPVRGTN